MSIKISDEDYRRFLSIVGELAALQGLYAAVKSERDYLRGLVQEKAAPKQQPTGASQPCATCGGEPVIGIQKINNDHWVYEGLPYCPRCGRDMRTASAC
jgi:CDP-diacylglycerol pyrophosphatase